MAACRVTKGQRAFDEQADPCVVFEPAPFLMVSDVINELLNMTSFHPAYSICSIYIR